MDRSNSNNAKLTTQQRKELYERMVSSHPDAVCKGDTVPYTSLNGNMYSFLSKDGFVGLRLPEKERVKFLDKFRELPLSGNMASATERICDRPR